MVSQSRVKGTAFNISNGDGTCTYACARLPRPHVVNQNDDRSCPKIAQTKPPNQTSKPTNDSTSNLSAHDANTRSTAIRPRSNPLEIKPDRDHRRNPPTPKTRQRIKGMNRLHLPDSEHWTGNQSHNTV